MDLGMGGGSQIPLSDATTVTGAGSRYVESPELAVSYLKSIYKPLKRHYDWFRRTQRGQIKHYSRVARSRTEAYRWRGRSELHVLTSGMDDYPRGPPHAGELHLDLISWMAFFTRTMREMADFVGEVDDEVSFGEIEKGILENIDGGFWSRGFDGTCLNPGQTCIGAKRTRCIVMPMSMMMVHAVILLLFLIYNPTDLLLKTNPITFATKATFLCSLSSFPFSLLLPHTWDPSLTC
jgi:hypothetical protein